MRKIGVFILLLALLSSCEQNEGVGGKSKIKGTLMLEQYNDDFSMLIESMPAQDENIYIQYGDSKAVGDDVETSPDGYFEFPYLYEGDYTIYYYSIDSADRLSPKKEVLLEVHLGDDDVKDLGELKVFETLDYDEGKAIIKGFVKQGTSIVPEQEVYLRYGSHNFYDERIRTQEDGSFYFNNVIPGDYTIYVFSEIDKDVYEVKSQQIKVTSNEEVVYDLEDFFIEID